MLGIMFISGLVFGSFYNVVGLRLPKEESFIFPNSHCPKCKRNISYSDNIPLISYIILKGKCRYCELPISKIYPLIEFLTGILFMYAFYVSDQFNLFISLSLASIVIIIMITDIHYYLIPNKILAFFMGLFIIIRIIEPLTPWYDSLIGFSLSYLIILLLILMSRGGMGAGDMKYLAVLAFLTGTKIALIGFVIAILFGGIYGVYLLITKRNRKSDSIPFGPFIGISVLVSYYYHAEIIKFYITAFYS